MINPMPILSGENPPIATLYPCTSGGVRSDQSSAPWPQLTHRSIRVMQFFAEGHGFLRELA